MGKHEIDIKWWQEIGATVDQTGLFQPRSPFTYTDDHNPSTGSQYQTPPVLSLQANLPNL